MADQLGCDDNVDDLVAWAVGGTFEAPFVVVDEGVGGCEAGNLQWEADFGTVVPIAG